MAIFHSILAFCGFFLISSTAAELQKRETACSSILIKSGDTCITLAAKCGITTAEFSDYNTESSPCSSLTVGKPVCCSTGTLDLPPKAGIDGLCYIYTVQADDTCAIIADGYEITVDEIQAYNNATFGWNGCSKLHQGSFICLSSVSQPTPVSLPDAVCGPQVPGTARPSDMSELVDLNPCIATNCKCNLNVGKCYNTVDPNAGCAAGTGAATASTSTAKAANAATTTPTKSKTTLSKTTSTKTKTTSTEPTATSTKTKSTMLDGKTTDSTFKAESATTPTTSIVQITTASWEKTTSTTPTSIVEITTASSTSKTSTTRTSSITSSDLKTTTTTKSTSTTTSAAAASTSAYTPWEVAMYSKADCTGDYYLLSGINLDFKSDCLGIHSGLSSAFTETGTWCRWFTDGGSTSTKCDAGTLVTPVSWYFTNAMCQVFPSKDCTNTNGTSQAYTSARGSGCTNYADATFKVSPWGSLWCSGVDSEFL
ncbi:hypothetical protein N7486_002158 [Penicillium sp. IBT 16267x]|nr:hypothetical protein N7486_002158 [Penicillium sp. IBT 16267x]